MGSSRLIINKKTSVLLGNTNSTLASKAVGTTERKALVLILSFTV